MAIEDRLVHIRKRILDVCDKIAPVNGRENIIGKALLVRRYFMEYLGEIKDESCTEEENCKYLAAFFEPLEQNPEGIIEKSVLGALLAVNYIRTEEKEFYIQVEAVCKMVKARCMPYVREKCNALKKSSDGVVAKTACLYFLLLVLCEEENEMEEEIREYVNVCLSRYSRKAIFACIDHWIDNEKRETENDIEVEKLVCVDETVLWSIAEDYKKLILYKDGRNCFAIFWYLKDIMDERQQKKYAMILIADSAFMDDITKQRVVDYMDYLLENSEVKEIYNLLSKKPTLYKKIGEFKGLDEESLKKYFLRCTYPERILYYMYKGDNLKETEVDLDKLNDWWEHTVLANSCYQSCKVKWKENMTCATTCFQNRKLYASLTPASVCWAKWLYLLERMISYVDDRNGREPKIKEYQSFVDTYKEEFENMPEYPYASTDYIKKIADRQSEIFCLFFRKGWNITWLMNVLKKSNVFLYENDCYFSSWPALLIAREILEKRENYAPEIEGFKKYCKDKSLEETVELYMNTNMHFIYNLKEFFAYLRYRLVEELKQKKTLQSEDLKNLIKLEKQRVDHIFDKYPIRARIICNEPDIRARRKVYMAFYTIYTGFYDERPLMQDGYIVKNEFKHIFMDASESWCESHKEEIWTWPKIPVDCVCKIKCGISAEERDKKTHYKVYFGTEDIAVARSVDKEAELGKFLTWMQAIITDKIIYEPFTFYGERSTEYCDFLKGEALKAEKPDSEGEGLFPKGYLCAMPPSQTKKKVSENAARELDREMAEAFALKVVEVFIALKNEPDKVLDFLILLNRGSMDAINEYKYNHCGRNNGGVLNSNYELTYSRKLKAQAQIDLEKLCTDSLLDAQLLADIYMNTYLRQYVSIIDFFGKLGSVKKKLDFKDFTAGEYRNEDDNFYRFCLQFTGVTKKIKDKNYQVYRLYPPYEKAVALKQVEWLCEESNEIHLDKKGKVGCGNITGYNKNYNVAYVGSIKSTNYKNKKWDSVQRKCSDLKKAQKIEEIRSATEEIRGELTDKFDYYKGTRLAVISQSLAEAFYRYHFDLDKCLEALRIFEKENPYRMNQEKARELLEKEQNVWNILVNCQNSFLQNFIERRKRQKAIELYYKSFFCICMDRDSYFEKMSQQIGISKETILDDAQAWCEENEIPF